MAKKLKDYTPVKKPGPEPLYPWDEWFDGNFWRLIQGEDFDCSIRSMEHQLRKKAVSKGLKVSVNQEDDGVVVRRLAS
jgi:hypothetical protein